MKIKNVSMHLTMFGLLTASLACSLIGGPPATTAPTPEADSVSPTTTAPAIQVTAITTGGVHACALLSNGKVKCWGNNEEGQLGDGTDMDHRTPVEVSDLDNAVAISAGGAHTCALTQTGEVRCWGQNSSGQLGDGTKDKSLVPLTVPELAGVVSISAGMEHTCAVTAAGAAMCWGKNLYGRVGNGSNTRLLPSPVTVEGLSPGVLVISAGNEHTCALTQDGAVKCWGNNGYGQLGDDTTRNRNRPTDVMGLAAGIKTIATGFATSCALTTENGTLCWGWIGLQDYFLSPHPVEGLERDIASITVGADHICGLMLDGSVKCLGENEKGQLGNGATTPVYSGQPVNGLSNVTSISASFAYTCALVSTGEVSCWGNNSAGQLGNGTNTDSATPVQVVGLTGQE